MKRIPEAASVAAKRLFTRADALLHVRDAIRDNLPSTVQLFRHELGYFEFQLALQWDHPNVVQVFLDKDARFRTALLRGIGDNTAARTLLRHLDVYCSTHGVADAMKIALERRCYPLYLELTKRGEAVPFYFLSMLLRNRVCSHDLQQQQLLIDCRACFDELCLILEHVQREQKMFVYLSQLQLRFNLLGRRDQLERLVRTGCIVDDVFLHIVAGTCDDAHELAWCLRHAPRSALRALPPVPFDVIAAHPFGYLHLMPFGYSSEPVASVVCNVADALQTAFGNACGQDNGIHDLVKDIFEFMSTCVSVSKRRMKKKQSWYHADANQPKQATALRRRQRVPDLA